MPDPQQQVNALIAGEIDLIEQPPHDLIPILKKDKSVQLVDWNPLGQQFVIRFNHLQPSRSTIRRSAWPRCSAMRQEDYLKATVGEPAVLQGLHGRLRLRHAQRLRRAGRPAGQAGLREVQGAAQGGGLRRHAGRADAVDHAAGADQHRAGHQVAARAGRLQGRHAVDGLADAGHAPHQEGSGRTRAAGTSSTPSRWRPTS